jgi:capsular exopolysaccharide synthesis family protein
MSMAESNTAERKSAHDMKKAQAISVVRNDNSASGSVRQGQTKNELTQGLILLAEGYVESAAAAERFRILRAKIERKNLKEGKRTQLIAVTSAVPAEGKSVVAVNLARALSIDPIGRALIIDCDLRKPTVHQFFRLGREGGVSDALYHKKISKSFIHTVAPGLDVMTAGTPVSDAAQAIEQVELPQLLNQLREYYRYIIVDCPPALLCPEPITISSLVDTTLLTVRSWRTDKQLVQDAVEIIGKDKLMGVVLNDAYETSKHYTDYGYYSYQSYSTKK